MTILKIKSLIYRYTGIYLANKEENDYITSKEFWKSFLKMVKNNKKAPKGDKMSALNIQGLLVGLWQSKNGLARPICLLEYKRPKLLWKPIGAVVSGLTALKWDIERLVKKFRS